MQHSVADGKAVCTDETDIVIVVFNVAADVLVVILLKTVEVIVETSGVLVL